MNVQPIRQIAYSAGPSNTPGASAALLEVLWRRRWCTVVATLICLMGGVIYLRVSTPVYLSAAKVSIEQNAPTVLDDNRQLLPPDDAFLYAQAEVMTSAAVLSHALDAVHWQSLKTFAKVTDPIDWLQHGKSLNVDVGKKDDVVTIAMESPYPDEAAAIVNAIVDSYLLKQSNQKRATGAQIVQILQSELDDLDKKRDDCQQAMLKFQAESGTVSFGDTKGNLVLDRLSALSTSLTAAELNTFDLRAQQAAAAQILSTPQSIRSYVEAEQTRGRDFDDKEYDDMRNQLGTINLTLSSNLTVMREGNTHVRMLQAIADSLKQRIAQKEREIAEAHLQDINIQLSAAEAKEAELRTALADQQKHAIDQNPQAAEYARLSNELERTQKQRDVIESRVEQVNLDTRSAGTLNIEVLDPAVPADKQLRPRKSVALAASMMMGILLGTTLALVREWRDTRLRKPEEIMALLDTPVIGLIPAMEEGLSSIERAQVVDRDELCEASEAFRALRTTVRFGAARDARTILVTSPTPGEGKSMVASNLAIALAQDGRRTLLIDCDLRKPALQRIFGISPRGGLCGVVGGSEKLRDAISSTTIDNLYLLPAGPALPKPAELISGKRFGQVMQSLAGGFDQIVIDSPPIIPFSEGRILAASADATIVVVRMNRSMREASAVAIDGLHKVGANILGVVANDVSPRAEQGTYYRSQRRRAMGPRLRLQPLGPLGDEPGSFRKPGYQLPAEVPPLEEPQWVVEGA